MTDQSDSKNDNDFQVCPSDCLDSILFMIYIFWKIDTGMHKILFYRGALALFTMAFEDGHYSKIWNKKFILNTLQYTTLFLAWNCLNTYFHNQVNYLIQYTPLWIIDFSTTVCGAPWNWCPFFALVVRIRLSSLYAKWETRIKEKFYT